MTSDVVSTRAGMLDLAVDDVVEETSTVRTLSLVSTDGQRLPSYVPGSNLPVRWRPGRFNSYSLTGDGFEPCAYTVSVRLSAEGGGGSRWMHELRKGDRVAAMAPRADFPPVWIARKHLLLAGGIGVTPILSHARSHRRWGRDYEVHYVAREAAHLDELRNLDPARLHTYSSRGAFADALTSLMRTQPMGTHLYVCGPQAMIDAVLTAASDAFWPRSRIHYEAFELAELDPGSPFTIAAERTGVSVEVASGVSALEALEEAGVVTKSLCRRGFCGECRTHVLAGRPVHRDEVLDEDDRERGEEILICVSRAEGELRLDI
jgi:ferredoxin-NADP reductase